MLFCAMSHLFMNSVHGFFNWVWVSLWPQLVTVLSWEKSILTVGTAFDAAHR